MNNGREKERLPPERLLLPRLVTIICLFFFFSSSFCFTFFPAAAASSIGVSVNNNEELLLNGGGGGNLCREEVGVFNIFLFSSLHLPPSFFPTFSLDQPSNAASCTHAKLVSLGLLSLSLSLSA